VKVALCRMRLSLLLVLLVGTWLSSGNSFAYPRCGLANPSRGGLHHAGARRSSRMLASPSLEAVTEDGGIVKSVVREGKGEPLSNGAVVIVKYKGEADDVLFGAADNMIVTVGEGSMIPGWDAALRTMKLGERAEFTVSPKYGYGAAGIPPVIAPSATLDFQVEILDYKGNMLTDATLADSSPLTPRTPTAIKAEFERRQMAKAPEKTGLEGFIEWARSIYVFGFFEGSTGEALPWYLRPLITFPAMFALVGATFYVVLSTGSVTLEREVVDMDRELLSLGRRLLEGELS